MKIYTIKHTDRETGKVFNTTSIEHNDVFEGKWEYGDEEEHITIINTYTKGEFYNNDLTK